MIEKLLSELEDQGYKGRIVSAEHLPELQVGIEGPHVEGLLDDELYQDYLSGLKFNLPEARSLIVVAVPHPQTRVTFAWEGKAVPTIVPPTYLHSEDIDKRVEELLAQALAEEGYSVALANLPKKLTAVRSGLARYGRNNISYVPGMGSFYRLVILWSDFPLTDDDWREPQMLDKCETCTACLRKCPTGAIASERFLLHAERCLTFHNEKGADVPFAEWIDPSAHNCLVGCMHCQRVCPENKDVRDWVEEGEKFSEDETAQLVAEGAPADQLPAATAEKIERADLFIIPRNLSALLSRAGKG